MQTYSESRDVLTHIPQSPDPAGLITMGATMYKPNDTERSSKTEAIRNDIIPICHLAPIFNAHVKSREICSSQMLFVAYSHVAEHKKWLWLQYDCNNKSITTHKNLSVKGK